MKFFIFLAMFFYFVSFNVFSESLDIDKITTCNAYLIPKDSIDNEDYLSFTGKRIMSQSANTFKLKARLKDFKDMASDICDSNNLEEFSGGDYLGSVYFKTNFNISNASNIFQITHAKRFKDDSLVLISSSDSQGDRLYNLRLSMRRGLFVSRLFNNRKNIFIINIGDSLVKKGSMKRKQQKFRSVIIYGMRKG